MEIEGEKLLARREFEKKWKEIRQELSKISIKTDGVDEVISNWGSKKYTQIYIKQSTRFQYSLEKDIWLVATVEASNWNPSIFKEVLDLICFLSSLFEIVSDGSNLEKGLLEDFNSALNGVELA